MGMGSSRCGYGFWWVTWVAEPVWVSTVGQCDKFNCTPRALSHGCHGSLQLKLEVHLIIVHVSIVISTVTPQHLNQRRQHHPAAVTTILCKQDDINNVNNDNNDNNDNNEANNNNDTDNNNKTMSTGTQTVRHNNNTTRQYHDPDTTAGSATLMGILMRSSSS
ncbi:hypothetical protein EDB89DRAFT_1904089 [Lactarius sanguifluus]|nr:hypothetical protein EDB89DRAFT_1904089 [Lactarius sanguifluus]